MGRLLDLGKRALGRLGRAIAAVADDEGTPPTPEEREELLRIIRGEQSAQEPETIEKIVFPNQEDSLPEAPTPPAVDAVAEVHARAADTLEHILTHKVCNKCGEEKPLDAFYRMKRYPDGRRPTCKACMGVTPRQPKEPEPEPEPLFYVPLEPAQVLGPCGACGMPHAEHREDDGACPFVPETHYRCSKCLIAKPLDHFHRDRSKSNGHRSSCKDCERQREKQRTDRGPRTGPGERACRICGQIKDVEHFATDAAVCSEPDCTEQWATRERARRAKRAEQKRASRSRKRQLREAQAQDVIEAGHKVCDRCEADKPLDAFPRRPAAADGRSGVCSVCVSAARGAADPQDVERKRRWAEREQSLLDLIPQAKAAQDARRAEVEGTDPVLPRYPIEGLDPDKVPA
jgi:hypothetical protein